MFEDFKKIISEAIRAPSGDNCQPWKFEISNNKIFIINDRGKDLSLYNCEGRASLIAHGGLIESIKIISSNYGYITTEKILPKDMGIEVIAEISLEKVITQPSALYQYIEARSTNRKCYKKTSVEDDLLKKITNESIIKADDVTLRMTNKNIERISKVASLNEKIVLENRELHDFLYGHITFSDDEDKIKKGFFIDTLEIKGIKKYIFRLLKNWRVLLIFNKLFGMSDIISKENAVIYGTAPVIGGILIKSDSEDSYVMAGRTLVRLWLTATSYGLSFHPLAGMTLLNGMIEKNGGNKLSIKHRNLVTSGYSELKKFLSVNNGQQLIMLFRLGYAEDPSSRTRRRETIISIRQ